MDLRGMNRLAVIRKLVGKQTAPQAQPMGIYATQHPEEKTKRKRPGIYYVSPRPSGYRIEAASNWSADNTKQWVREADAKPAKTPRHKRGHRTNPLAEIARKMPAK